MIFEAFDPMNQDHADYFRSMPSQVCSDGQGIVAVTSDLKIAGMVYLHNWTETAVTADIKCSNPMCFRKGNLISEAVDYVFNRCKMLMILATVHEHDFEVLHIDEKIGFQKECLIPQAFSDDEGMWMMSMRKEQCNYIEELEAA